MNSTLNYYAQLIDAALRSWPATFRQNDDTPAPTITFEQRPFAHLYLDHDPFTVKIRLNPDQQKQAAAERAGLSIATDADPHGEWRTFVVDSDDSAQTALNWLKAAYDEMMRQELAARAVRTKKG